MKICPRLLIFELSDCTLRIFRGYDFSIFLILLFLDRYFGVFDTDLRASPLYVQLWSAPRGVRSDFHDTLQGVVNILKGIEFFGYLLSK